MRATILALPLMLGFVACADDPGPAVQGRATADVATTTPPVPVVRIASTEARAGRPLTADAAAERAPTVARAAVPAAIDGRALTFSQVELDGHDLLVVRTEARGGVPANVAAAAEIRTGCTPTGRQWAVQGATVLELACP